MDSLASLRDVLLGSIQWNAFGAFGFGVGALSIFLGALVSGMRPDRPQNRVLGLILFFGGLNDVFYFGVPFLATHTRAAGLAIGTGVSLALPLPMLYLLFLGTVRSPLTAWLRWRAVPWLLLAYTVAVVALRFVYPRAFVPDVAYFPAARAWLVSPGDAPLGLAVAVLWGITAIQIYGFLAAASASKRSPTPYGRAEGASLAMAFGARGVLQVALMMALPLLRGPAGPLGAALLPLSAPVLDLLTYALLSYAILKAQLFDIDLRIKRGIEYLATAFFIFGGYTALKLLLGSAVPISVWIAAAGGTVMLLALRPVRHVVATVGDFFLPQVDRTPEYIEHRKTEVYRHALEPFMDDSIIDGDERQVLDRLRGELGMSMQQARAIELRLFGGPSPESL